MGKAKQTRKFAVAKRMMSPNDTRVRKNMDEAKAKKLAQKKKEEPRQIEQANTSLFFRYNEQLGPPYHVLVDTNFINFSIRWVNNTRKIPEVLSVTYQSWTRCCCITDCDIGEQIRKQRENIPPTSNFLKGGFFRINLFFRRKNTDFFVDRNSFSLFSHDFLIVYWNNHHSFSYITAKNSTWSEPWWIVCWPSAYPAWRIASWRNWKNWAENTRLHSGWPRIHGLSEFRAIAKRRDTPMTVWQIWHRSGNVSLWQPAIRNCGDGSEKYPEFPACTLVDTNTP